MFGFTTLDVELRGVGRRLWRMQTSQHVLRQGGHDSRLLTNYDSGSDGEGKVKMLTKFEGKMKEITEKIGKGFEKGPKLSHK